MTSRAKTARSLIPWLFVAGMAIVVAVNGALIYFAVSTWSGRGVDRSYQRGVAYNAALARAARQEMLGWDIEAQIVPADAGDQLAVVARDSAGDPLLGLTLRAIVERPVGPAARREVELTSTGPGVYAASMPALDRGQWEAHLNIVRDDVSWAGTQRLFVR